MATKQRRTRPSVPPKKASKSRGAAKPVRIAKKPAAARKGTVTARRRPAKHAAPPDRAARATPAASRTKTPAPPPSVSSHDEAVEVFERGFIALQRRDFKDAARLLTSILGAFPEEKELHERARVYIAVCERQAAATDRNRAPKTVEERVNAATVAINSGAYERALDLLRSVDREDGDNDLVKYMLGVVQVGLGDADAALPHLREAVELNPENRYLAAQDADLEPLREHPDFIALLDTPPAPRRRPATRARSAR